MVTAEGHPEEWRIESAGTWADPGRRALPEVVEVMAERQIDLTRHRSRTIDAALMEKFALYLVMEPGHKEALQAEFPNAAGRIFLLTEMIGQRLAVLDPTGADLKAFQDIALQIRRILGRGKDRISELARI